MKPFTPRSRFLFALAGLCLAATLARAEMIYLMKITDFAKQPSYELMTGPERSALLKEIQKEERCFPKVLAELKKEWMEDELSKGEIFPAAKLAPRKAEVKGTFTDRQSAQKKLDTLEERAIDDAFEKGGKKKKRKSMTAKQREKAKIREAKDAQKEAAAELLAEKIEERIQAMLYPAAAPAEAPAGGEAGE
ncbi:MAG: hypothetical protein ACOX5G_11985 [Kiritimatiellia bacterium]|jgi:hypothetical protein